MAANDALKQSGGGPSFGRCGGRGPRGAARRSTPLIKLPPPFKNTPAVKAHSISHYDQDGPYWAWNWFELGEHSGTHFDAPVHWIPGKDY